MEPGEAICYCQDEEEQKKIPQKKKLPNLTHSFNKAKGILQRASNYSGDNVFDHLSELIKRIIDEEPPNVMDYFDEFSRIVREEKFNTTETEFENFQLEPKNLKRARAIMEALKLPKEPEFVMPEEEDFEEDTDEEEVEDEDGEMTVRQRKMKRRKLSRHSDVTRLQFYWKLCGFGVNEEPYLLSNTIEKFEQDPGVLDCRFWGKIMGIQKNYYILEVDLSPTEIKKRAGKLATARKMISESGFMDIKLPVKRTEFFPKLEFTEEQLKQKTFDVNAPQIPIRFVTPRQLIPYESPGEGLNRKTYYVCNSPVEQWTELPPVEPEHIRISKSIRKQFTGDLEQDMICYPPFPGKEKHYLRAMIARITSGTHIAPKGYVQIKGRALTREDDEKDEEEAFNDTGEEDPDIVDNPEYKPIPLADLMDISSWQHTRKAVLKQGRVMFFRANKRTRAMGEETVITEEEVTEEESVESIEIQPRLFQPCVEDVTDMLMPPWSTRLSAHHSNRNLAAVVQSNIWPGARAFAMGQISDNMYIGNGQKHLSRNFMPHPIPEIQNEYPIGPEVLEIRDPDPKPDEPPVQESLSEEEGEEEEESSEDETEGE